MQLTGVAGDVEGQNLTYQWVQTAGPTVSLSDATAANPTFTAPEGVSNTDVSFELRVSDGTNTSVDTVTIHVNANDDAPSADAGSDQTVEQNATVQLSAAGGDVEGGNLTYRWVQTAGPPVALSDPNAPNPTFIAPAGTGLFEVAFELRVSDGTNTSVDTLRIEVLGAEKADAKSPSPVQPREPVDATPPAPSTPDAGAPSASDNEPPPSVLPTPGNTGGAAEPADKTVDPAPNDADQTAAPRVEWSGDESTAVLDPMAEYRTQVQLEAADSAVDAGGMVAPVDADLASPDTPRLTQFVAEGEIWAPPPTSDAELPAYTGRFEQVFEPVGAQWEFSSQSAARNGDTTVERASAVGVPEVGDADSANAIEETREPAMAGAQGPSGFLASVWSLVRGLSGSGRADRDDAIRRSGKVD